MPARPQPRSSARLPCLRDVGRGLLLSLVRYDVEKLEAALEETNKPLLVLQTTFVNDKRERASMRAGQTTPYLDYIRAKVPAACIEVLPGLGHFPQLDAPAETNRAIEESIASLEVSASSGLNHDSTIDCRVIGI